MFSSSKIIQQDQKLACITLDYELDYGDRVEEFNIINEHEAINDLAHLFKILDVPVSSFIRTDMLLNHPGSLALVKLISTDYHCHSHTHNTTNFDSISEISTCAKVFEENFGYKPIGYRAPQGVLNDGDIELLKKYNFKFSSSIFPSFRPGKFNNLSLPTDPFYYNNNILEIPFAVINKIRYTVSMSYLKLIGYNINRILMSRFGLPNILIFDSHLHDFIISEKSFNKLNKKLQFAWGIRKNYGMNYFKLFINYLKSNNYRFVTMTDLYNYLKEL